MEHGAAVFVQRIFSLDAILGRVYFGGMTFAEYLSEHKLTLAQVAEETATSITTMWRVKKRRPVSGKSAKAVLEWVKMRGHELSSSFEEMVMGDADG